MNQLKGQYCPICHKKTLTLSEDEIDVPYFGKAYVFGMDCSSCGFSKHDIEFENPHDPTKVTFIVESEKDLDARFIKSSAATIKIPTLRMTISPGPDSEGYVTNIEGFLNRVEKIIRQQLDDDDKSVVKSAKNLLKKLRKVRWGEQELKIVIEDPTGNSVIISEKAKVEPLKVKRTKKK